MRIHDRAVDYGWVSIILHWLAGIGVMVMLLVGSRLAGSAGAGRAYLLNLHTTIGILAYPLLWARIAWRASRRHPGPLPSQQRNLHFIGRMTHYVMLICMALMLVSGPLTAWSSGNVVTVFGRAIIDGGDGRSDLFLSASQIHHVVGLVLTGLVLFHIAAAIKHMAFDRDGTIEKILIAGARPVAQDLPPQI